MPLFAIANQSVTKIIVVPVQSIARIIVGVAIVEARIAIIGGAML